MVIEFEKYIFCALNKLLIAIIHFFSVLEYRYLSFTFSNDVYY